MHSLYVERLCATPKELPYIRYILSEIVGMQQLMKACNTSRIRGVQQSLEMCYLCTKPSIVTFPNRMGQGLRGVELAPSHLTYINNIPQHSIHPIWCTDNIYENLEKLYMTNVNLLNCNLLKMNEKNARDYMTSKYFSSNEKYYNGLINIGGDHSMAIATVAATQMVYSDVKVLWFDAHPDLNTFNSSMSKNIHGMPLSFVSGLEDKLVHHTPFITNENQLDLSKQVMYVGIRDIDDFEADMISQYSIQNITIDELEKDPVGGVKKICDWVGNSPVHISFDVDVVDPLYIPSTGTPVMNGMDKDTATYVMTALVESDVNIVNMDITELNMHIGDTTKSCRNLCDILMRYLYRPENEFGIN